MRASGSVGTVGLPTYGTLKYNHLWQKNAGIRGGVAPARKYIPVLLKSVLDGTINPGKVFTYTTDLDHIADAYQAMDKRTAIKSLIKVGEF